MPWAKTDAGRLEIQTRSAINGRAQRNLLLLIDGKKSQEQLLASVTGTTAADFSMLRDLGLITSSDSPSVSVFGESEPPINGHAQRSISPFSSSASASPRTGGVQIDIPVDVEPAMPSFGHVSKTLTSLIASELGLRGFTLTLAVERAANIEALLDVAERVVQQIETRRGIAAADKARRALFGG
ncbi:hypothetical protein BH09PSE5_BH09PSE5_30110 [soil metagenome]